MVIQPVVDYFEKYLFVLGRCRRLDTAPSSIALCWCLPPSLRKLRCHHHLLWLSSWCVSVRYNNIMVWWQPIPGACNQSETKLFTKDGAGWLRCSSHRKYCSRTVDDVNCPAAINYCCLLVMHVCVRTVSTIGAGAFQYCYKAASVVISAWVILVIQIILFIFKFIVPILLGACCRLEKTLLLAIVSRLRCSSHRKLDKMILIALSYVNVCVRTVTYIRRRAFRQWIKLTSLVIST
jgi:hypothetical protein